MTRPKATRISQPGITSAAVVENVSLCREHYRLTLGVERFPQALPGQFVQLSSPSPTDSGGAAQVACSSAMPFLPRAFSIGGLRRAKTTCAIDIIYRVIGSATGWMESLRAGDTATVLGPLGRSFPISDGKPEALLVIGGVGLPPLLWLAAALKHAGKKTVAIIGAQTRDLIPLEMTRDESLCSKAESAVPCSTEFAAAGASIIISTDDGSCGYHGNAVQALAAFRDANPVSPQNVVVYACGPEPMMQATAEYCLARDIECHVCLERPMACGVGTCQSCVVTVRSQGTTSGQRYALCCAEGPVFAADQIIWGCTP
jgi:dihydroorotate dehydrogenase electron transfer subunit